MILSELQRCKSTGKIVFTKNQARERAAWWRRERQAIQMSHYKCGKCKGWHIGNDRRKRR